MNDNLRMSLDFAKFLLSEILAGDESEEFVKLVSNASQASSNLEPLNKVSEYLEEFTDENSCYWDD